MKYVFSILLTLSITIHSFGQIGTAKAELEGPKSFIGLNAGYITLFGDVTSADYNNVKAGFANSSSYCVSADGAIYFLKYLGIGALTGYTTYGVHDVDKLNSSNGDFTVSSSKNYTDYHFLIGPYFGIPIGTGLTLETRALIGAFSATTPEYKYNYTGNNILPLPPTPSSYTQKSSTNVGLGLDGGVGLRIKIISHLSAAARLDYLIGMPKVDVKYDGNSNKPESSYTQNFGAFTAQIGANITF